MRPALRLGLVALALTSGVGGAVEAHGTDLFEAMGAVRLAAPLPAPDVTFRSLDGQNVRLADLKGKPVLLGFFTTW